MGGDLVETCKMLMGLDMQNAGRLFPLNGRSGYDEVRIVQGVTVRIWGKTFGSKMGNYFTNRVMNLESHII